MILLLNIEGLKAISDSLYKAVTKLKGGNRTLVRITKENETMQLAIYATEFRMHDEYYKLVSFQNIRTRRKGDGGLAESYPGVGS